MAGNFTSYNKIRPGAYVNVVGVPKATTSIGNRGVVAIPMELPWGADGQVIEVLSTDFASGNAFKSIGLKATDAGSLLLRLALSNSYKALVYKTNSGGTRATATVAPGITATAIYAGANGNRLTVRSTAAGDAFEVSVLLDGTVVDKQTITTVEDYAPNGYITLAEAAPDTAMGANAGIALAGGTNGTTAPTAFEDFMSAIETSYFNVAAFPTTDAAVPPLVLTWTRDQRERAGKKIQSVVLNYPAADYEGVISVEQGYRTETETVEPYQYVVYRAGVAAAAEINRSSTYHVIAGAKEIINPLSNVEIERALTEGRDVLSMRQDGAIVIEKDINTLHTFTPERGYDFSKNRVIRVLDSIAYELVNRFETKYIGQVTNNDRGRTVFKAEIMSLLSGLQDIEAIKDYRGADDVEVIAGQQIEDIIVNLDVHPTDAMERAYITLAVSL
jgi:hypothetical protein